MVGSASHLEYGASTTQAIAARRRPGQRTAGPPGPVHHRQANCSTALARASYPRRAGSALLYPSLVMQRVDGTRGHCRRHAETFRSRAADATAEAGRWDGAGRQLPEELRSVIARDERAALPPYEALIG